MPDDSGRPRLPDVFDDSSSATNDFEKQLLKLAKAAKEAEGSFSKLKKATGGVKFDDMLKSATKELDNYKKGLAESAKSVQEADKILNPLMWKRAEAAGAELAAVESVEAGLLNFVAVTVTAVKAFDKLQGMAQDSQRNAMSVVARGAELSFGLTDTLAIGVKRVQQTWNISEQRINDGVASLLATRKAGVAESLLGTAEAFDNFNDTILGKIVPTTGASFEAVVSQIGEELRRGTISASKAMSTGPGGLLGPGGLMYQLNAMSKTVGVSLEFLMGAANQAADALRPMGFTTQEAAGALKDFLSDIQAGAISFQSVMGVMQFPQQGSMQDILGTRELMGQTAAGRRMFASSRGGNIFSQAYEARANMMDMLEGKGVNDPRKGMEKFLEISARAAAGIGRVDIRDKGAVAEAMHQIMPAFKSIDPTTILNMMQDLKKGFDTKKYEELLKNPGEPMWQAEWKTDQLTYLSKMTAYLDTISTASARELFGIKKSITPEERARIDLNQMIGQGKEGGGTLSRPEALGRLVEELKLKSYEESGADLDATNAELKKVQDMLAEANSHAKRTADATVETLNHHKRHTRIQPPGKVSHGKGS